MEVSDGCEVHVEDKKYSLQEVQRLTNLSLGVLQEILQRHHRFLTLEVRRTPAGMEEVVLDKASLERIMVLREWGDDGSLTLDEASFPPASVRVDGSHFGQGEPLGKVFASIDTLSGLVQQLQGRMDLLLTRYHQVLQDLQRTANDNMHMTMELEVMREKQQILSRQLQQAQDKKNDPVPDPSLIN